jgi:hypothetical protein
MTRWTTALAAALCALLTPALANAQAIAGTVTDSSGAVVPGVTVEARSPALIEQVRTVVTDAAGLYSIVQLVPGVYTVSFTLPGFATIVREGIVLTTGFTADVDAQLRVGAVGETITVTGSTPIVDVQNVAQQRVATRDVMDSVPVAKTFQSLGVLIPGITTAGQTGAVPQDVAGQSGNNHMNLAIHGGRQGDQHMHVDGMSVEVFTREDGSAMWFSDTNYQEYVFDYSANSPEVETGGVRVNMIPREGGNRFSGGAFYNVATQGMQSSNIDDDLRSRGLRDANRVEELWNFSVNVGGPVKRNRLWFFLTHSRFAADTYEAGVYFNRDARARTYVPDLDRQGVREGNAFQQSLRLTWQATPRNKITAYWMNGEQCHCFWLIGAQGANVLMPDATSRAIFGDQLYQATWTSPVTNRLLLEAAVGSNPQVYDWNQQPFAAVDLPGILEQAGPIVYRNKLSQQLHHYAQTLRTFRGSVAYVTGSHAAKVGFTMIRGSQSNVYDNTQGPRMSFTTLNGAPVGVTFYAYPNNQIESTLPNLGIYGQDQWRLNRVTVNAGVRFDFFRNSYPDQFQPPSTYVLTPRTVEGQTVVSWRDLSPRVGASYDLFGNGKTAIKGSASRYVLREGVGYAAAVNPARNNATVNRGWTDLNNNFFPDGDPRNPAANGELGLSTNLNFGQPILNTFYDEQWAFGFGNRPANWEFSAGLQHELRPGFGVNVGYFRRIFTNFELQDNRAVGSADYSPYCVTAPVDPRLPEGGGYELCGLFDLVPTKVGQIDRISTGTKQFGTTQKEHWNGFDFTANARIEGVLLQGGVSTGKRSSDYCAVRAALPENTATTGASPTNLFCNTETPFLTQIKLLGSYTLPYDIQVSGTLQSVNGPEILANVVYTSDQVQRSLGRALSGARTVSINVVEPGTLYGTRWNQVDLRVTKLLRVRGARLKAMFDLYNALNDNTVLRQQNTFVPNWQQPLAIMPARLAKIAFQFDL